ncbi:MAG TPA: hypothetical protein VN040_20495 [Pseudosphingobacterium sp.]|jgi:PBP1b-binding outer membrane lipoprotein LpoB|nr:hypothetical protein [Pseudosphingobacterium sp.]
MKKLMFTAAFAAILLASCGNSQQGTESSEGMGDSLEQEMTPTDTSGTPTPTDTAVDTTTMP